MLTASQYVELLKQAKEQLETTETMRPQFHAGPLLLTVVPENGYIHISRADYVNREWTVRTLVKWLLYTFDLTVDSNGEVSKKERL